MATGRAGSGDAFRGLYVSDAEADWLLARPLASGWDALAALSPEEEAFYAEAEEMATVEAGGSAEQAWQQGEHLRLHRLAAAFGLDDLDVDALLICLAPELDLRYERVYAYLQDDVTKKRPTVDLALGLLSADAEARLANREYFTPGAPLIYYQLLRLVADPSQVQPPLLGQYLKLDERIVGFLLGSDDIDERLTPHVRLVTPGATLQDLWLPAEIKQRLAALIDGQQTHNEGLLFYFQGVYGVGKGTTAEAMCCELGLGPAGGRRRAPLCRPMTSPSTWPCA